MALINVKEDGRAQRSNRTASEATVTRFFIALYDAPARVWDAELDVLNWIATNENAEGILPGDESATLPRRVKQAQGMIKDDESPRTEWWVQIDYSDQVTIDQNPLDQPDEITWDFSESEQAYFLDNSSPQKHVVNSAGEPFQDFLKRETGQIHATVKRNVASYDPPTAVANLQVVNSDSFTIDGATVAINQAKLSSIAAGGFQVANVNGFQIRYRQQTFTLKFRQSWDDVVGDYGFNEVQVDGGGTPTGKLQPIATGVGTKVDKPWPLNGAGARMPNSTDTPASLTFKPYEKVAFASFGFS
jgi:hypothetical protein